MKDMESYTSMMEKCSHCAFCEAVCPIFKEDLLETHVARSRLLIIQEALITKTLPLTRRVREIVNRCLLCGQCRHACPGNVPVDDIVIAARHAIYGDKRSGMIKRQMVRQMMALRGESTMLKRALTLAHASGVDMADYPNMAKTSFSKLYPPGTYAPRGPRRGRVAYFVGCATNAFYPDTGDAVMQVMKENNIEVVIPDQVACCGMPALADGDVDGAERLMRANIDALAAIQADAVITDCTSCLSVMKEKMAAVIDTSDPMRQAAEKVAASMADAMVYLDTMGLKGDLPALSQSYTFHIPCHASGDEALTAAPLALLSYVDQARYLPLDDLSGCCGAGGTFFTRYKTVAANIRKKKLDDIAHTQAALVVTGCPSCRTYIQAGLKGAKPVIHPMVLLARGYGFSLV